jgi:protein Tex
MEKGINETLVTAIAQEMKLNIRQVFATMLLLQDDATVPFIARYRKEMTGSLDEVQVAEIRDRADQMTELGKRKTAILKSLKEQEKLTPELEKQVQEAKTMTVLEDLYLPFKPKRKTRASVAKEKGLEPLAELLLLQSDEQPETAAEAFVNQEKGVTTVEEALQGARDIIAERVSEDASIRGQLREIYLTQGKLHSQVIKGKETEGQKFKDYFDWEEPLASIPSHRMLAIRRGREETFLSAKVTNVEAACLQVIKNAYVKKQNACAGQVELATEDSFQRLLNASLQVDVMVEMKKRADAQAIRVFAENIRELFMAAPLGQKRMMGIDPGFRTGCKVVCLDAQGKLLFNITVYPTKGDHDRIDAERIIPALCKKFDIQAIAIGNGTASRETEAFVRNLDMTIPVVMVSESGASIYSASEVAREEFPDQDITVRGAVSIARRLMDPLAELVKLDPKSIGVGQYQHDVNQRALKKSLDDVVMSCVNKVGVDVNTASKQVLNYVSGLGARLAQNIIQYRDENGGFVSREDLKKVPLLGNKAYEQAAGFLRVPASENNLDGSAVHPERYPLVETMAKDIGCSVEDLMKNKVSRDQIDVKKYVSEEVGLPTLEDIVQELDKPGRDPREKFEMFAFSEEVHEIMDLQVGMKLPGIITNVADFGAFVDVGVHQDGLVHVSELADHFVRDPRDVAKVQQTVTVTVMSVDLERRRIALSMRSEPGSGGGRGNRERSKPEAAPAATQSDWQGKLGALKNKWR